MRMGQFVPPNVHKPFICLAHIKVHSERQSLKEKETMKMVDYIGTILKLVWCV